MNIGIFSESLNQHQLIKITKDLKTKILTIPYISKVEIPELRDREIHIKLDLEKLDTYYISLDEIINKIKGRNIEITGGTIESYTLEKTIITLSKFKDITDVQNVIIRGNYDGNKIYLKDIATIEDRFEKPFVIKRYNGKNGLSIKIFKKESADIIKTTDMVYSLLDNFKKANKSKNIFIEIINDNSMKTKDLLKIVNNNAIFGFIFVIIILFFFMNFKNALWTAMGIPTALCFAFIFFPYLGITINSISLMGIIIMLGIVVDDAIIISENIYRYNLGEKNENSNAVNAISEVAPAVITSVLTTIVAFLPILFWKSLEAKFAIEIPIVVIFILIGSIFEAFLILPNHLAHNFSNKLKIIIGFIFGTLISFITIKTLFNTILTNIIIQFFISSFFGIITSLIFLFFYHDIEKEKQFKERKIITILKKHYSFILNIILRYRYLTLILFISVSFSIIILLGKTEKIKFEMYPDNDIQEFLISGNIKNNISLKYTSDTVLKLEHSIINNYYNKNFKSIISTCGSRGHPEYFSINVILNLETSKRKNTVDEIIQEIRKKMVNMNEFTNINIIKDTGSPDWGRDLELQIIGDDDIKRRELTSIVFNFLAEQNSKIIKEKKKSPNLNNVIYDIERSDNFIKNELILIPKYNQNSRYGISPLTIANAIRIAYDGFIITDFKTNEEIINYRLIADDKYRDEINTIKKLKVSSNNNKLIPVDNLVNIKEKKSEISIFHYNGVRNTLVSADLDTKLISLQEIYSELNNKIKQFELEYPGLLIIIKGSVEVTNDSMNGLINTLLIALMLIAFILIFLFKSFLQPLIVLIAIPFAVFGVIITFFFHGMTLGIMAILGIIGLCGVVVNDSLVLVEYINRQIKNNPDKSIIELVKKGAITRFRPIILTTLTTVAGLFPTVYGLGGKNKMIIPVAMSMSWGLIFATVLTLILIPCLYLIIYDIKNIFKQKK
jgi:multidrug efflux pump subunit AcrB